MVFHGPLFKQILRAAFDPRGLQGDNANTHTPGHPSAADEA